MNSKIYRCGFCGSPTDSSGTVLDEARFKRVVDIVDRYPAFHLADHTHLTNGDCCRYEQEPQMVQITRDMAIDAGDRSLEGEWIKW